MDNLLIKALTVSTQIGVYPWEQKIKQNLLIDITIPSDFSACEDDLAKTVDCEALCRKVTEFVESNAFHLIETVANDVADLIKREFGVTKVFIEVSKPQAIANAVVAVAIER